MEKVTTTSRSFKAIPLPGGEEDENINGNAPLEKNGNSNGGNKPLPEEYELFHSTLGYEVIPEDDDSTTCVIEGDMLMIISKEEGESCKTLIQD